MEESSDEILNVVSFRERERGYYYSFIDFIDRWQHENTLSVFLFYSSIKAF